MTYRIREVDPNDDEVRDELHHLHDLTFNTEAPIPEWEKGFWWFAYHKDLPFPIGFAGVRQARDYHDAGYMERCGVVEDHKGNGLQKRFIRVRERKARKIGWKALWSDTTHNVPSANNLIKAGFRLWVPKEPWGMKDALYWEKELK